MVIITVRMLYSDRTCVYAVMVIATEEGGKESVTESADRCRACTSTAVAGITIFLYYCACADNASLMHYCNTTWTVTLHA